MFTFCILGFDLRVIPTVLDFHLRANRFRLRLRVRVIGDLLAYAKDYFLR
jgi:hypothetical protein